MKINFTLTRLLLFCFLALSWSSMSAHNVNYYTETCNSGPTYSVQPNVTNVNSNSNYAWQYKNASGTWVCITNGNNTINGNTYSVTGASFNATVSPGPIVFTNPNSALQGLEIRCLISDGAAPCTMPSGNSWTSTTNHFINVNGSPCSTCNNVTDAGLIGSNETVCGTTMNPALITNIISPSGGSGTLQYVWLISTDGGATNTTISGATNDTYDPPTITQTTWYRRCSRRSGCSNYDGESNWVMKELSCCSCAGNLVSNNSFEYGTMNWDYSGGTFTAGNGAVFCGTHSGDFQITNTSSNWVSQEIFPTSYAAGTTLNVSVYAGVHVNTYYQEVFVDYFDANWNYLSNTAVEVNKVLATAPVGPQLYTFTSTIPAGVGHISIGFSGNGNWIKTDNWCVTMGAVCNNVTSAGTIGNDETLCGTSVNPSNIVNLTLPSGGNSNTLEYVWLMTTDATTVSGSTWNVTTIAGATGSSYDPPVITQTTWYRRCARRAGCLSYDGESNWVKKELTTCCTATITGLQFKDPTGANTTVTPIVNGGTYSIAALTSPFNVEALLTGNMESVRFTVTGSASSTNIENSYTWDYAGTGSTWPNGAGTFTMLIEAFSQDNALGSMCASQSFTFTLVDCNNLTSGGTIGYDESLCGVSVDPSNIVNVASPSGGSGTIEYMWLVSTNAGTNYTAIAGATSATYDPGPITQTTWYRRCARNYGCTSWVGESNWVMKELKAPVTANAGTTTTLTCSTPSVTLGVASVSGYSYTWSPATGLSSSTIAQPIASPVVTTTYTVTVTGSNGCTATSSVLINVNKTSPVAVAGTATTINCTTTSATLGATSTAGYTYSWSPSTGLSSTTIAQPVATPTTTTTYTVTVTGSNGCTATSSVMVTVNKTPPGADAGADKNLNCTSTSTTIGTAAVAGNTYSWSPSTGLSSTTVAQPTANPSTTTTYTVTVTGSNGCTSADAVIVNVNTSSPVANAGAAQTITCSATSFTLGATSVSGYTYSWSPATGLSSTTIAQPIATPTVTTTYTVTVTGSNGCTASSSVTITVNKTPPTANAGSTATLTCSTTSTIIGTTAIAGNTYTWSPATGLSSTTIAQPTASPSTTTTYTVTVTGANGCTATSVVVINVNTAPPVANAGNSSTLTCTSTSTLIGTAAIAGNSYSWSPSTGLNSVIIAQPTANPTSTTTYTVTVTGANGCTASSSVTITVNTTPPTANAGSPVTLTCTTPSATLGVASVAGYTYSWSPATGLSSTTIAQPIASPSATTTYTVTVTGSNGCTANSSVLVTVNKSLPTANAGTAATLTCTTTSTTIGSVAISGNTYSWSPATGLSSTTIAQPIASPTATTTYTVTVTGSNGCTASSVVTITVNTTPPTANAGIDRNLNCTTPSANIGSPAVAGNTYSWSPAAGLSSTTIAQPLANPTVTTTYTVTVTGANGCTSTDAVVVNVNTTPPTANAGNDQLINCSINSVVLGTTAVSGYTYLWNPFMTLSSNNIAQPTANPNTTTTYTVTVTGTNGCTASDVVVVTVNVTPPSVTAVPSPATICNGSSSTITATGGQTYLWNTGATTASITVNPTVTTTYTVTATGSNGCTASTTATVNVNQNTTTGNNTITACNSYTWNGVTYTTSGVYTYTSLNTSGCLNTATLNLTINYSSTNGNLTITNCGPYTWNGTTYTASGVYTYTSLNASGCVNTATLTLTITTNFTPSILTSSCNSNGTDNVSNDDYITFTLQPSTGNLMSGKKYSVTATQGLNPITITLSDGSPATGLYFGYPNAFRTATGTAGQGNITLTITAANGCSNTQTLLLTDPGSCSNVLPPCTNGTVTYTYRTPYQTTNLNNVALSIPKFDDMGGTRILSNVNLSYTIGLGTISVLENTSSSAITGNTISNSDATIKLGATNLLSGTMAPINSGVQTYGAPVLVPAGINASGWPGDSISGIQQSTLNRSLKLGLEDYLQSIFVDPTQSLAWVTNITGLGNTDDDMNYFAASGTIAGSSSYTSATDMAPFIGTGNAGLTASTNTNVNTTATGGNLVFIQRTKAYAEVTVTYNYSTACYGTVGNYVWIDSNHNGQNDEPSAAGMNGVTVELYKETASGSGVYTLSQTTTTANSPSGAPGYYLFTIPQTANYYVHFPSSITGTDQLTSQTTTPATDNNSDASTANGNSPVFTITINGTGVAKNNLTIDAGYVPLLSLGNLVWADLNRNGLKDASESGISGATVNLYNDNNSDGSPDGAAIATVTSNANGQYIFNNVFPGNYVVGVVPPAPASGNAYAKSPVNELNPNLNVDNNNNGISTTAGQTFSGTITLLAGTEPLGELPNNGTASDANSNLTLDFGFYQPITISGNVFVDNNGPTNVDGTGIGSPSGTQVYANLVNAAGNVVAVVAVNANGTYSFFDVAPNTNYTMVLSTTQGTIGSAAPTPNLPGGWINVSEDCCDNTGNDGTTNGVTSFSVGLTDVNNVNFGIRQPLSLGNAVWNDANKNGIKDATEIGISGATVKLYNDANLDGTPDGAAIATTITNSNGLYVFNELYAGNYIVGVTPPTPVTGNDYESSTVGQENNPNLNVDNNDNGIIKVGGETISGTVTLDLGTEPTGETPNNGTASDVNSNLTVDFGFYQPVNISGNVFVDNNGPANVDGTGIGAPGGTQLYANLVNTTTGAVEAVVPVNPNGTYFFADVRPNTTFSMILTTSPSTVGGAAPSASLPNGWANVSEDCCDNTGNDGATNGITTVVVGMTDVPNVNFGIREPMSLGNLVWNDINKNGLKETSESGISGATVKLYADANLDGVPDGAALATTTTNSNGFYVFNDLFAGNYVIGVTPPVVASGNAFVSSVQGQEANPNLNVDNNDNGIVTVAGETRSGTVNLSLGAEPTGENPNNGTASDANSNLTVDFGFYQPVNISGNVFVDNNGPTNVDGTGIGAPGGTQVYANLVNTAGNVVAVVPVNSNGTYSFLDVTPNTSYTMVLSTTSGTIGNPAPSASLPNGWINVSEDCCDNTGNDGNTNGITSLVVGMSDVTNVNFGIREPLSLGNAVWNDINRNGLKEISEPAIVGATVKLYADANLDGAPDGAALATTTTNSNGLYSFNDLFAGNYIVGVTPPTPAVGNEFESSVQGEEANPNLNVDNNDNGIIKIGSETISGTVNLSLGAEPTGETPNNGTASDVNANLTVDFGFYQPVNISGNVFVDNNGPANVDGTGIGAPSGTQLYANLVNASGIIDAVVPVNPNGTYFFADVRPNTTFTMVLSTTAGSVGGTAPTASLPNGWVNVSEDCCDNTGNDGTTNGITTVTVGLSDVPNVNFGIKQPLSVGNLVWLDVNRDGLKDASENGISGATVNLYADANSDGVPDGAALLTATTNVDGLYVFNGLDQGNYVIGVVPPTGNVYTSSINGQEINPNLNVDNNDNGIVTIAGETRSGTITLIAGTEPLGETPNNGNAPDANSNLTIDFGFFVCPSGFTFNPQYVCPGQTINLTALEPANYTGGVWSQGGVTVTNTNVTAGTYLYTFTNGTCTSTGTITIGVNVPDYTPTITIAPSAITGVSNVRVIINISEILNKPSCSDVYIFVPRLEPRFVFGFEPTATVIGGVAVNNNHWQYFTSNPNFYVWKYTGAATFPAGGSSKLGFVGSYDPNQTDGATTFSVQIFQGSGGETNITNNTDSENLIYFR